MFNTYQLLILGSFMNRKCVIILILICFTIASFAQDQTIKAINDSIVPAANYSQYELQHKNAFKMGFLTTLFGATSFTYERSLKPSKSLEATVGIIGLGLDVAGTNPSGLFLKLGYKFIKIPNRNAQRTHLKHLLDGSYIRPEISFSNYSVNSNLGDPQSGFPKLTNKMYALMVNAGKQWILDNRFLIDWFVGLGYGNGQIHKDMAMHYAFIGGVNDFPVAISTGIRIGVVF